MLIKYYFRLEKDCIIPLGTKTQKGTIVAIVYLKEVWKRETLSTKILSLIKFSWKPKDDKLLIAAQEIFILENFGNESDYGDKLLSLMAWHNSRDWELNSMLKSDKKKSDSLDAFTILTRTRLKDKMPFSLNLKLQELNPDICCLVYQMVDKIPVISFQYFLDIHCSYTFNSIRSSKHPLADSIISYIYEILYLQQKTSISLYEYSRRVIYSETHKKDALLINAEVNAILGADLVFSYLKASIEKSIILVGLTFEMDKLDSKKTHKAKVNSLTEVLPEKVVNLPYCQFFMGCIKSENLDELNSYRSGLLHKRGISDLQPHNYCGEKAETLPLRKIFQVLHEQHSNNTAMLISALALLTDDLINRDPSTISTDQIHSEISKNENMASKDPRNY